MQISTLALILLSAAIGAGCASTAPTPEAPPAPAPTVSTAPPPAPVASSEPPVDCTPAPSPAKKGKKSNNKAKDKAVTPPECQAVAKAAPPAGKAEPGKPRIMKSKDGTFGGEVYGSIPPGSKWSKLQIGMEQGEVEAILGVTHEVRHTPTGKAFIPFYFGTDRFRNEHVYRGQGSVSYTSGSQWGAGRGVLMMINYDPNI